MQRTASAETEAAPEGIAAALGGMVKQPFHWLLLAAPVTAALKWFGIGDIWIFVASGLAIIPLAGLMGRATENLASSAIRSARPNNPHE